MAWIFSALMVLLFCGAESFASAKGPETRKAKALYDNARKSYLLLDKLKEKRDNREEWLSCIEQFKNVYETYPQTPEGYKAAYTMARLYHHLYRQMGTSEDGEEALRYYQKTVSEYTFKRLDDDALFYEGEIYFERKKIDLAVLAFKTIVEKYPDGDQAGKARKRLRELQDVESRAAESKSPVAEDRRVILRKVSYSADPQASRVVVYANGPVEIFHKRLTKPDRFYVNFKNAGLDSSVSKLMEVRDEYLQRIRVNQFSQDMSRMVLDMNPDAGVDVSAKVEDDRVVIELRKQAPPPKTEMARPLAQAKAEPVAARHPAAVRKNHVPLIVIDPGHGGKDHGAEGESGLLEKDVNLEVAKKLKSILEKRYKYRVLMTREDDAFVSLKDRGALANEKDATLFVSVHANAAPRKSAKGIETYYLGIGSSDQAKETAARENGDLVGSVKDNQVQNILADLISTTKINDSSRLAGKVQHYLHQVLSHKFSEIKNLGVKEGPFFVLHDANMPSILVEVGFITNVEEERRLDNAEYMNWLAFSMARGIGDFLRDREPAI
ncbi:MAG: N-acetylmuramoyl-L-alanine amidase [Nitrospinae bacterium]|nr:N-acetylmuramoyl-L-alanine amidase [Nitrospinota bacterium]